MQKSKVYRVHAKDDADFHAYMESMGYSHFLDLAPKNKEGYNYYFLFEGEFGTVRRALVTEYSIYDSRKEAILC